jgi:Putative phage tail protein
LQRELYVRTKFTFKLSWEYCLIDPMDIVTITDANLGLTDYSVRVIQIEEDDRGLLAFTCEELVAGISNPAYYPSASSSGYQPNQGVPAVPVNTPLIVEPPTSLTGGLDQIWVGASGINGGGGTQWGGANVYASIDNVTYSQVAVLTAPLRQGFLTAALPAEAGWDSVDTLAVNLAESGGALAGTSQAAAQQGATLSIVDGEFLAYETATLVSGNAYNLTGLARGLGGSTPAAHSTGAPFARIDGAVIQYTLPANFAGQTLYLKFQSFNVFGGGAEDLSTCTVYSFIASAALADPIFAQLQTGFALDLGEVTDAPTLADDFGSVTVAPISSLDLGSVAVTITDPIAVQLLSGTTLDLGLTTSAVTVSDVFGSTNDAVVDVIDLGTV